MNNDQKIRNTGHLVISHELIALFRWFMENNQDEIKHLIRDATHNGLRSEIRSLLKRNSYSLADMQHDVGDFFSILEQMLFDSIGEQTIKKAIAHNLMPSIEQIDNHECDRETVRSSIEQATNAIQNNPNNNPKEQLYKEILLNWEPGKNNPSN